MTDRERIHQLVDRVLDIHGRTGHYVEVEIGNYGYDIRVCVMEGGFVPGEGCDLYSLLDRGDSDGLLGKDPGGGNREEVQ